LPLPFPGAPCAVFAHGVFDFAFAFAFAFALAVSPISNPKFEISVVLTVRSALAVVGARVHHRPGVSLGFRRSVFAIDFSLYGRQANRYAIAKQSTRPSDDLTARSNPGANAGPINTTTSATFSAMPQFRINPQTIEIPQVPSSTLRHLEASQIPCVYNNSSPYYPP
jgi:hypothetical protein